jgi:hypothetical protein
MSVNDPNRISAPLHHCGLLFSFPAASSLTGQAKAVSAASLLALAVGAAAFGAVAIGALAVGRLVVGRGKSKTNSPVLRAFAVSGVAMQAPAESSRYTEHVR